MLGVGVQRGLVPLTQAQAGVTFPLGGEPDWDGELGVAEVAGQHGHATAGLHRGELPVIPGGEHLAAMALGQVDDRVKGLRSGGDDYLAKPYAFSELLARVEVLARRRGSRGEETVYRVGDLELNRLSHEVSRAGQEVQLQPREFRLLEYLMRHAGQVVTRTMLLENVWDYHFDPQTNVIDVHISRLRSKIDKGFAQPLLHTIRGAGYMIRDGAR